MKQLYSFILVLVLQGCAINPSRYAPETFNGESQNGAIAGTITIIDEKPRYDAYDIYYRKKNANNKKRHRIHIQPTMGALKVKFNPDYKIGNQMVHLFVLENEPGEYEFTNFDLFTNLGYIQDHFSAKKDFSIPFQVEKGKIVYIGDIILYPKGNSEGYIFEWKDNYSREQSKLKEKFPTVDWSKLKNGTIKSGVDISEGIIQFE